MVGGGVVGRPLARGGGRLFAYPAGCMGSVCVGAGDHKGTCQESVKMNGNIEKAYNSGVSPQL